jgi:O-antigen/teichoic acid export membrane protein
MVGQIILAHLLVPRDFGLVALAIIAVSFASVIRQTGIQQILVQRHKHFRRWANPAFWFEFVFGLATALLLAAASPIAALVFHSKALMGLILVSAAAAPLSPWFVVPTARLMIDMRFKAIAAVNVVCNFAMTAMSVFLAWRGFGAYSFLIPIPVAGAIRCCWLWRLARPRITLNPQFRRWRFLIGDSGLMIATGFLNSVMYQAGYLALGLLYPKAAVGQFFFALNLSGQLALLLSQNLGGVLLPALAKLQEDSARHAAALMRALRMLAFVSTPLCLLLAVVAKPLVVVIYGPKWLAAAQMLELMALTTAISIPASPAMAAIQSQGSFALLFRWTALQTPVYLAAIWMGAWLGGGFGVAVAWFLFTLAASPISIHLALRDAAGWRRIAGIYAGPLAGSLIGISAFGGALLLWPMLAQRDLLRLGAAGLIMALIYPVTSRMFSPAEFAQARVHIGTAYASLRRKRRTDPPGSSAAP